MRLRRVQVLSAVAVATLALQSAALADYGLTVRQWSAQPRQTLTVWGNACGSGRTPGFGMPIYLVPAAVQIAETVFTPHPPGAPYRLLGRMSCANTYHAWGDGGFWHGTLRFRVPEVRHGRYQLVIYCQVCHRGAGANLVASNWYFDGSRRRALNAVEITRVR